MHVVLMDEEFRFSLTAHEGCGVSFWECRGMMDGTWSSNRPILTTSRSVLCVCVFNERALELLAGV